MDSLNVQNCFTCGICLERFDESSKCPRMLSCGHSFCHSCLKNLIDQSPSCPTCKAEILFERAGSIPINVSLKSLISYRSQIFVVSTSPNQEREIREQRTSTRKYLSEGYCNEHEHFKELRCMDCEVWICGMCGMQCHRHCRTLVVQEAYKELKKQVSQKVQEELGQRKTRTEGLTESLKAMEEERRSLIEEIKRKELELKDCEKRIEELESLKAEENKFCYKLKQLQTIFVNSANDAFFSRTLKQLENLLQEGKKQIPVDIPPHHLPQTRESLGTLCQNKSVYAVEDRYDGTRYGKVALKDGQILVDSFQEDNPEDATLFQFPELLSRFNNGSSELPKTVFLRMIPDGERDEDSFEVIIKTDGLTPRAKNFILLCSALKGPSYKGETMYGDYSIYYVSPAPPSGVEGIRNDDPVTPREEGGLYGMRDGDSLFQIPLKDDPYFSYPKFGVVVAGLELLKEFQGKKCSIKECGLVI